MYGYGGYNQNPLSLIRVTGIDGAKAFQMPANSSVALFDGENDLMYIKSTDGAGFPTIRTFRFEEVQPTSVSATNEYMTRQEVEEYVKQLISTERTAGKSNSRKSKVDDEHTDD